MKPSPTRRARHNGHMFGQFLSKAGWKKEESGALRAGESETEWKSDAAKLTPTIRQRLLSASNLPVAVGVTPLRVTACQDAEQGDRGDVHVRSRAT